MKLEIRHKENYSRGELLLRLFFGFIYIGIPHLFCLTFVSIWAGIQGFIAWWAILFTGVYPKSMFDFAAGMIKWNIRLAASLTNLIEGYPQIGVFKNHPDVELDIPYPERISRGGLLLRTMFGALYAGIPHIFCLYFRFIAGAFLNFFAFFSLLFTGSYPKNWFDFLVGNLRWSTRMNLFLSHMDEKYPPFTGKAVPEDSVSGPATNGTQA